MCEDLVTISELNTEESIGECFQHNAFYLNAFFFSH